MQVVWLRIPEKQFTQAVGEQRLEALDLTVTQIPQAASLQLSMYLQFALNQPHQQLSHLLFRLTRKDSL